MIFEHESSVHNRVCAAARNVCYNITRLNIIDVLDLR